MSSNSKQNRRNYNVHKDDIEFKKPQTKNRTQKDEKLVFQKNR